MSQTVNEKKISPRPETAGRDEKQTKTQLQYTPFGAESQALISILGQDNVIEMLYSKWFSSGVRIEEQPKAVLQAEEKFHNALDMVTDMDLYMQLEELDGDCMAAQNEFGFYCGARYMLNLIFGGELFEN